MQEIVVEEHPVVHYYWNDEEVSEDEYYADKNAVFDSNIASAVRRQTPMGRSIQNRKFWII